LGVGKPVESLQRTRGMPHKRFHRPDCSDGSPRWKWKGLEGAAHRARLDDASPGRVPDDAGGRDRDVWPACDRVYLNKERVIFSVLVQVIGEWCVSKD